MFVPAHGAAADLDAFSDGIVDGFVGDDDVASLAERGDYARDGGEGLCVDDAGFGAQVGGNVGFGFDVHVLGAVEAGGGAGTDAVGAEDLDGAFLKVGICAKGVEVVGCEVCDGAAIGELGFRTCRS